VAPAADWRNSRRSREEYAEVARSAAQDHERFCQPARETGNGEGSGAGSGDRSTVARVVPFWDDSL
jgi:hypothetical protein